MRPAPLRLLRSLALCAIFAFTFAPQLFAAPTVNNVSLRGLQVGGTTTIKLQGNDLLPEPKLIAPFAIEKQEVLPGATNNEVQLQLTLAKDVQPGFYAVRLASHCGISPPLMLGVDHLPQQPIAEQLTALPVAMTGALGGGQIIKSSFAGKQGQSLVADVEVQRLGANFKPVVRLYDSRGKQVAWSPPQHTLGGDARLAIVLPADDTYTLELHDLLYRAGGPGHFRLKVGALTYADFVMPLGITKGTTGDVTFAATNLAAGTTAKVDATASTIVGPRAGAAPALETFTGGAPRIEVSAATEAIEQPQPAGQRQKLANIPSAVSGTITAKAEEDQYVIPVTAGEKLRIDVFARRLNSLLDGVLVVRGLQGNELARSDDQPGTSDPGLDFTVPAGATELILGVRDMEQRFGEAFVYRLAVRSATVPSVMATIGVDTVQIPVGSSVVLPVNVVRSNYDGPLKLTFGKLFGEIEVTGDEIPAGANMTLLTLTAKHGYPVHSVTNLVIRASDPNIPLASYVLTPETSGATRYLPWLRQEIAVAAIDPAPLSIDWNHAVENPKTFAGSKMPLALKINRREGLAGDVRLRVMTTQTQPKKKIKENNQDKEVDDVDRTLRLAEGQPVFKPDMPEPMVGLQIPADLPKQPWGVVVVAELLAADGKTVVSSTSTSFRSVTPEVPFTLEVTSPPMAEGRAGLGAAGNFTGKIVRNPGFTEPVKITLVGLPPEVKKVPEVLLTGDAAEFTLPLTFEFGSKVGEYKNLKLSAFSGAEKLPSGESVVEVKIVAGDMPPAPAPAPAPAPNP